MKYCNLKTLIPAFLLVIGFNLCMSNVWAQSWEQQILQQSQTYQATFHQRKIFVQTDRPVYSSGETIWLSAFILNAYSNKLNDSEKVLYVELLTPDGKTNQKEIFKVEGGRSIGDLELPLNLESGKYRLVAYTNWMRNFGSMYYFSTPVYISNAEKRADEENTEITELAEGTVESDLEAPNDNISYEEQFDVRFYPEGGNWVTSIPAKIAFEVKDTMGHPVQVNTIIKDDQGQIVTAANTLWKGKGMFNITAMRNRNYYLQVLGSDSLYALPEPEEYGISISLPTQSNSDQFQVVIHHNMDSLSNPNYFLLAMQNGKPISGMQLNLSGRKEGSVVFDVAKFKTGIAQFTLFDANKRPLCERIKFVNNTQGIQLNVTEKQLASAPRGLVSLELAAKDQNGFPVSTDLAVAITDAERIPDAMYTHPNLYQYVAMPADLPLSASEYASVFEQGREAQFKTELLMLTNGWRRYTWKEVLADTIGQPQFLEEPGIYVQGVVRTDSRKEKVPKDVNVSMISQGSQMELFTEKADNDGNFTFLLKDFQDTLRAVVQTKNQMQIKRNYKLNLFTNYYARPTDNYSHWFQEESDTVLQGSYLNELVQRGMLAKALERSLTVDTFMVSADVLIDEVTVNAEKPRTDKENMTRKYGAPDQTLGEKRLKDLNEEKPWNFGLMSMLDDAFPSLEIMTNMSGGSNTIQMRLKDRPRHRFYIFVDGELITASNVKGLIDTAYRSYTIDDLITMDGEAVKNIDLIFPYDKPAGSSLFADAEFYEYTLQAFSSNESAVGNDLADRLGGSPTQSDLDLGALIVQSENMAARPAILAIYTKDGGGVYSETQYKGVATLTIHGFTRVKEFYEPDYSASSQDSFLYDYRNTLAWYPQLKTDENGKATISFYTSDVSGKIRVEANGIDNNGNIGALRYTQSTRMFTASENNTAKQTAREFGKVDLSHLINIQLEDGKAAAYVMVKDTKNKEYSYSSLDGSVDLNGLTLNPEDRIEISKPGYQTLSVPFKNVQNSSLQLKKAEVKAATEVTAKEVMRGFFKNKSWNSNDPYADYKGAFRELLFNKHELHRITDFAFNQEVPSLFKVNEHPQTEVIEGRDFHSMQAANKIKFTPTPGKTGAFPEMNPIYDDKSFLNQDLSKYYDYTLDGKITFNDREVYIVRFNQKADAPYSLYSGEMYIDVETYGLVKAIWKISENGKKYLTADEYILAGNGDDLTLLYEYNEASYDYNGDYWFPVYAITEVEFKWKGEDNGYIREMAWQASNEKLKVRPNDVEDLKKMLRLSNDMKYLPSSWRSAWMLAPNTHIISQFKYLNELYVYQKKK